MTQATVEDLFSPLFSLFLLLQSVAPFTLPFQCRNYAAILRNILFVKVSDAESGGSFTVAVMHLLGHILYVDCGYSVFSLYYYYYEYFT